MCQVKAKAYTLVMQASAAVAINKNGSSEDVNDVHNYSHLDNRVFDKSSVQWYNKI